jgi:peroxiredoxin (alkyl hydroperoxide reductase subunit C)
MISNNNNECFTIGRIAPDFTAITTQGTITLSQYIGKWIILFSHPGDFTPVCTSEFIALAELAPEFEERNVQLLGISIDSNPSHLEWLYNIYQFSGVTIPFPLISDRDAQISNLYGMVNPDRIYEQSVRDVFIIDPLRKIRAILTYPATVGRNIYELLRIIDALQVSDQYSVSTPANWVPGQPVIAPIPYTYEGLLERVNDPESLNIQCSQWYMCFKDYSELTQDNTESQIPLDGETNILE